jgi:DNA (cytosine-5)-methyltransferase 1
VLPEGLEHRSAQSALLKKVPAAYAYKLHVNLVAHGQAICTAQNPRCNLCPIRLFCSTYRNKLQEAWATDTKSATALDLFSGVGGSSLGLLHAGYRILAALDEDKWAIRTFSLNHPELPSERALTADIRKPDSFTKLEKLIGRQKIDVVIGGPPCQGFSMIGERIRGRNGSQRFIDNPGNKLYRQFVHYVNKLQPRVVVMENVPALYSFRKGYYKKQIIQDLSNQFAVEALEVDAYNFGVPQRRKRVLFIGVNVRKSGGRAKAEAVVSSIRSDLENQHVPGCNLRNAIGDLPSLNQDDGKEVIRREIPSGRRSKYAQMMGSSSLVFNHVSRPLNVRDQLLYRLLKPGEKASDAIEKYGARHLMAYRTDIFSDKYRRLRIDDPSPTVMAHLSHDGHMYICPDPKQNRSITVREAARIQSFPDGFIFYEPRTYQFRHVGNAVPPLLAATIGTVLKKYILSQ